MTPAGSPVLIYLHIVLGAAIVGIAFYNFSGLRMTHVPGRVKRIAQVSFNLILFLHVVNSLAIITQAAAVAIAYDMWEDNEFVKETEPGIVPPMPMP